MATAAEMLADAQEKYYLIITGQQVSAIVDQNGERIEYNRANAALLKVYIDSLIYQTTPRTICGPAGMLF